mgnify:FL=1|tara:strand:- start:740 stop:1237 length:498 start_codon:yes stop_codon:yes gene_type:complete
MNLEDVSVHFTDPTGTLPTKGRRLKGALEDMIFNARENITLVSYSMSTFSEEWFLWEEIAEKLSEGGIQLRVFGDKENQVAKIVNRYRKSGAKGWAWVPQNNEDSIFHIKALIVDESIYLGSANFSKLATTSSAEWGIISRSPDLCRELIRFLKHLVDEGRMKEI